MITWPILSQAQGQHAKYLILSAPRQASTLFSSLFADIPDMHTPACVRRKCGGAQEFLNVACICNENVHFALKSCMASELNRNKFNIWREECADESQWPIVLEYIRNESITFDKDNFSPLKVRRLQEAGFTLMVSWRTPWFTFPTGFYSIMHDALCNGTNVSDRQLLVLREHALSTTCEFSIQKNPLMPRRKPFLQRHICGDVTTHYIFFYKLITSAWKRGVSVVDVSKLMRLPDTHLPNYISQHFPPSLTVQPSMVDHLVNKTLSFRIQKMHGKIKYEPPPGVMLSEFILQQKLQAFEYLKCNGFLRDIGKLCAISFSDCARFNKYYFEGSDIHP